MTSGTCRLSCIAYACDMRIARSMQVVGYALYALAGGLRLIGGGDAAPLPWVVAYAVLGLGFHVGASVPDDPVQRGRRLLAIAIMTPAMIAMAIIRPCPYGALTLVLLASDLIDDAMLVLVASQVVLVLQPWAVAAWIVAQSAVIGTCLITDFGVLFGAAELAARRSRPCP